MKRVPHALLLLTALARPAWAAGVVTAHSSVHGDHSRVVFTLPSDESYTIEKQDGVLLVTFDAPGTFSADAASDDPRVGAIAAVPGDGKALRVRIAVPADATFQDFSAGNRVIVDIAGTGKAAQDAVPSMPTKNPPPPSVPAKATLSSPPVAPSPTPSLPAATKAASAAVPPLGASVKAVVKMTAPSMPPATLQTPRAAALSPPMTSDLADISLALTEERSAAAFVRSGRLWLVFAPGGLFSAPKVTGPHAAEMPMQRTDLLGAVLFTAPLPPGGPYEIYGGGGGLVWTLALSPLARDVHPAMMQRVAGDKGAASAAWKLSGVTDVIDVPDAQAGDTLKVALVGNAGQFAGPVTDTVDFTALRSVIGLAIAEKADNLTVTRTPDGVQVTRPAGLPLAPQSDVTVAADRAAPPPMPGTATVASSATAEGAPIFDFNRWATASLAEAQDDQRQLLAGLGGKSAAGQAEDLLTMAKMDIANNRGAEATGFLDYAEDTLPALTQAAQFEALRGAAAALLGRYDDSLSVLESPDLKPFGEVNYWRAYDLAWLEDWRQAKSVLPPGNGAIDRYPPILRDQLQPKLVEVELHAGDLKAAQGRLHDLELDRAQLSPAGQAGLDYLQGEAAHQGGDNELARKLWTPLVTGTDHLYRVRAGLALTTLELQGKQITLPKAIDRLEGLRYTWRGDGLEAAINFALGKLYIADGKYLKGFEILRDATTMDPESDTGRDITAYMKTQFVALLMTDKKMMPVDAAELYEEFPDLIPAGPDGDRLGQRIAERLVDGDMLGRAATILQKQVDTTLQGEDRARVAARLAEIDLIDKNPKAALIVAHLSEQLYSQLPGDPAKAAMHRAQLIEARSIAQAGHPEDAIAMLEAFPPDPETNALRADIAWSAGLWDKAAAALQDMIIDQVQDPNAPLTQGQADLILNRAVALNLSGNRVALANLHQRYGDAMSKTSRGKLFDIVARPRESALLSDKETLSAIVNEVDIYKGFLDSYRGTAIPKAPAK